MKTTNYQHLNRLTSFLFMLVMTVLTCFSQNNYDFVVDGLAYKKHADGKTVGVTTLSVNSGYGQSVYPNLLEANIPETVTYDDVEYTITAVENYAFSGMMSSSYPPLKEVVIPGTVISIGKWAFSNLLYLKSVTLGENVEQIGDGAFCECNSLESIVLPDKLSDLGGFMFQSCSNLKSVTIGKNVQSIGSNAFIGCSKLENIYCHIMSPAATTIYTDIFYSGPDFSTCTLHVPSGTKELYLACEPWSQFEIIVDDLEPDFDFQPWIHLPLHIGLYVGNTHQLTAFTNPVDMVVSWSSSDESVVTVDNNGLVTAIAPGNAIITVAESTTGVASATCEVTVKEVDNTIDDVNGDGVVDIRDVNHVINTMLGK
ncbi:MAG: leucine-rich repeat protein [Muribaculaceae bacterium]|nr:leucine-rich repeat protein [Muribaculaceae bacterium]